jgi:hypothetical protein
MITAAALFLRVEVRPPSARIELANVVRSGMVVLIGVWMFLAADSTTFRDAGSAKHLLPFQALIQDRPPLEQRTFRSSRKAVGSESMRAGTWPAAASSRQTASRRLRSIRPEGRTRDWSLMSQARSSSTRPPQQPGARVARPRLGT